MAVDPHERMVTLIDELGAASLEARTLLSDIRSTLKLMRIELQEAEVKKNAWLEELKDAVGEDIDGHLEEHIKVFFDELNSRIDRMVDIKAGQVGDLFNKLINLYIYGDEKGAKGTGGNSKVIEMLQQKIDELHRPVTKQQRVPRDEQRKRRGV